MLLRGWTSDIGDGKGLGLFRASRFREESALVSLRITDVFFSNAFSSSSLDNVSVDEESWQRRRELEGDTEGALELEDAALAALKSEKNSSMCRVADIVKLG
jgi:hypothetical protein